MKALTLWQPWAWAVAHAGKDIENRTWAPPRNALGTRIAIHAGMRYDDSAWLYLANPTTSPVPASFMLEKEGVLDVPEDDECVRGAILAVATLKDIVRLGEGPASISPWYEGPVGWVLSDTIALRNPVPCRGAQGLWTMPAEVRDAVIAQEA